MKKKRESIHQTGDLGDGPLSEDLYLRVVPQTVVPERGAALLFGLRLGLVGLAARRHG